uniref:Uncharacterized protein n=1 Tax=Rhizophora mucronata TaxID=61149 RepID=A0A2P2Q7S6_RHIMU
MQETHQAANIQSSRTKINNNKTTQKLTLTNNLK